MLTLPSLFRTLLRMTKEHFGSRQSSLQSTPSSPQRSPSRQRSTIPTSMRRARCACPSSVWKTGSQPLELTKVRELQLRLFAFCSGLLEMLFLSKPLFGFSSPAVIQCLIALVNSPQPDHPLRADLAEEYTKDQLKFMKNAEEFTKKHSEKRPID